MQHQIIIRSQVIKLFLSCTSIFLGLNVKQKLVLFDPGVAVGEKNIVSLKEGAWGVGWVMLRLASPMRSESVQKHGGRLAFLSPKHIWALSFTHMVQFSPWSWKRLVSLQSRSCGRVEVNWSEIGSPLPSTDMQTCPETATRGAWVPKNMHTFIPL